MNLKKITVMAMSLAFAHSAFAATPTEPHIAWLPATHDSGTNIKVDWNMWWGVNGTSWDLTDNGTNKCSGSLVPNGKNEQSGTCTANYSSGSHALVLSLCNADGCMLSKTVTISVINGDTSGDPVEEPEDPTPEDPTPDEPTPDEPTPDDPIPDEPTPDDPIPDDPTPDEPTPDEPTPDEPNSNCGIQSKNGGGYILCKSDVEATEAAITNTVLFSQVKDSIQTLDNASVEAVVPMRSNNPENVKRVESIISQADWNYLFALADPAYSYTRFLRSIAKFKGACATYTDGRDSDAICRKSLATMFAHFTQETGAHTASSPVDDYRQGLYYLREISCTEGGSGCGYNAECSPATWQGQTWPCGTNADGSWKQYFGRGAKQLSYNYNYGPFSEVIYGDVSVLLNDPSRVADSWLNLASAVFFFVTPQAPKPSMLHVIDGTWQPNAHDTSLGITRGFGATTNIINGGIECGSGQEKYQSLNRINYYRQHAAYLNVPVPADEQLGCASQGRFDVNGGGGMLISWDQDWAYYPSNPEGLSFTCKLVGYQTAYNALIPGNYQKCVEHYFNVDIID